MPPKTFQEAESVYERATNLELAEQFASAVRLYLEATEAFLHLSRSTANAPAFQAQCKAHAARAFQRAEKIRKASKTLGSQIGVVTAPIDAFGADYQVYALRRSATVNNIHYPLWDEPVPLPSNPGSRYSDPNGQPTLPPCRTSSSIAVTWKRASLDLFTSQPLVPTDIDQNIIGDCSVCATVAVCVQYNQKFGSRISIDDLLPFDDSGRPMGISLGQKVIAWPALIEKAYMKLMGGYDFPGSNSSIDLRVLTGWIPEHVELQSASFEKERTWERITNGFWKGCCVLTAGTDTKTILKIQGAKLLPSHDYAVVDIRETEGERWLTFVDSTVPVASPPPRAKRENRSGPSDSRLLDLRWDDICATFEGIYVSWNPALFQNSAILHGAWRPADANDKVQASVRCLRLLYECQNSPGEGGDLLDMRKDIWILLTRHLSQTRRDAEYISLTVHPEDEDNRRDIWVKTGDIKVKGPYTTSPHALVRTRVGKGFPTSSHATPLDPRPPTKAPGAFSILASYDGPFDDVFFTVNVFCGADIKVWWDESAGIGDHVGSNGGFSVKVDGTLTTKNAGGNHTHPTYMLNPQWHLRIYDENAAGSNKASALTPNGGASPLRGRVGSSKVVDVRGKSKARQKCTVVLSAQSPRQVPLNVTVVWSSGERIVQLAQKEVVTSSGTYTYGRARTAADMAPGDYTVILSAFEPQVHLGQFTLKIESSHQFDLTPIPQEGAGMYARVSKGEWDEHSAVGGPGHGRYHLNPIYEVQLPSSAQLSARLHLTSPAPTAALNLSLFPASSSASDKPILDRPLASSGPYNDALSGVSIPTRMLSPGRYWLVLSTFAAGVETVTMRELS